MTYVYAITDGINIKIGISKHPEKRVKQLNTGNSNKLILLCYFKGSIIDEKWIHNHFKGIRGEWMESTQDLLNYLNNKINNKYIMKDSNGKVRAYMSIAK
jgi:hypothetical protein